MKFIMFRSIRRNSIGFEAVEIKERKYIILPTSIMCKFSFKSDKTANLKLLKTFLKFKKLKTVQKL